jgi:hypothetical protein
VTARRTISPRFLRQVAAPLGAALTCVALVLPLPTAAQGLQSCNALATAEAALDQQAYRAVVSTASPGDEQAAVTVIEAIGADRARIFSRGVEFVLIGNASYARPGGSDWQRLPVDMRNLATQVKPGFAQGACEASDPVVLDLDGLVTNVYGFAVLDADGAASTRGTMWIGSDGLPRRLEVEAEADGALYTKSVVYDYDPSISIEAP